MQSTQIENHGNENIKVGDILFNSCFPHKPPCYYKVLNKKGRTLTVQKLWYRQVQNETGNFYTLGATSLFWDQCKKLPGELSCKLSDRHWYLAEI